MLHLFIKMFYYAIIMFDRQKKTEIQKIWIENHLLNNIFDKLQGMY